MEFSNWGANEATISSYDTWIMMCGNMAWAMEKVNPARGQDTKDSLGCQGGG